MRGPRGRGGGGGRGGGENCRGVWRVVEGAEDVWGFGGCGGINGGEGYGGGTEGSGRVQGGAEVHGGAQRGERDTVPIPPLPPACWHYTKSRGSSCPPWLARSPHPPPQSRGLAGF